MKKRLSSLLFLLLSGVWIYFTIKPMTPNSLGELMTWRTGLWSLESPESAAETNLSFTEQGYQVDIQIDTFGIPHIYGQTEFDAYFGLGLMHARDRYFQMELITRSVEGRLSELVGPATVNRDYFWLPYERARVAQEQWALIQAEEPEVEACILAYSAGVNLWLSEEGDRNHSPEYTLLGASPRAWEPWYTLLLTDYMSQMLTFKDPHEGRQYMLDNLPESMLRQLFDSPDTMDFIVPDTTFRAYPPDSLPIPSVEKRGVRSVVWREDFKGPGQITLGSNNWAVSGDKTADGRAILCNDTHLGITLPNPWYQAHLHCDDFHVYGFSIPCAPFVISGHNENIAWGVTNATWNLVDRYALTIEPDRPRQYYCDSTWRDVEEKKYTIHFPNGDSSVFMQPMTIFGKLVEDEAGEAPHAQRWYAMEGYNWAVKTFMRMNRAKDWREFNNSLQQFSYPPQNFAFADRKGNVGLHCAGNLPMKPADWGGGLLDGSYLPDSTFVPYQFLPNHYNPDRGFISSANQVAAKADYHIGVDWTDTYRATRINNVLRETSVPGIPEMMELQNDRTDLIADDLKKLLSQYADAGDDWRFVQPLMAWDGNCEADRTEPLIARYFILAMYHNFNDVFYHAWGVEEAPKESRILKYLTENDTLEMNGIVLSTRDFLLMTTDSARTHLTNEIPDFENWYYGITTEFEMMHIMRVPALSHRLPNYGGSPRTPNVNRNNFHAASMRTVIALGDTVETYTVIAGGQSGRLNSPQFKNQASMWRDGVYVPAQFISNPSELKGIRQTITIR